MKRFIYVLACLAAFGGACPQTDAHEYYGKSFTLIHPWAEPSEPHAQSADVFMHFEGVEQPDRLVGASSSLATNVELRGPDGNPAPEGIAVGPETSLQPGGAHLVLTGLKQPLELGRSYPLTLDFDKSGTMHVMISIGAH
jgi:copper(I)-binding protein